VLETCDDVRDSKLPNIGFTLQDRPTGEAFVSRTGELKK
jgi:hypothetical protein